MYHNLRCWAWLSVSMWKSACQNQLDVLSWERGQLQVMPRQHSCICCRFHASGGWCILLAVPAPPARALGCGRAAAQLCSSVLGFVVWIWQSCKNLFLLDLKIEFTFFVLLGRCVLISWLQQLLDLAYSRVFLVIVFFFFLIFTYPLHVQIL